jgi:AcrR family transcriptional regulator
MADRESRRQRRIERRQQEILDAAARIFAAKGYRETTTKEIAEAVDLAEGTLYHYYGGKSEILVAILKEIEKDVQQILQQVDHLENRQDIVDLAAYAYRVLTSRLPFSRTLFIEAWMDDAVLQNVVIGQIQRLKLNVQGFIDKRITQGVFRPVDPELTASMLISMCIVPIVPVMRGVQPPLSGRECQTLAQSVIDLVFDGLYVHRAPALGASAPC